MFAWIGAKMATAWVKVVVILAALLMPVCLVGWIWQSVALNGLSIGWFDLVDGARGERDKAVQARDAAVKERDIYKGNADRLGKGLERCNASVDGLAAASKKMEAAAQALVDQARRDAKRYADRVAAVNALKETGAQCPAVDEIFRTGFR